MLSTMTREEIDRFDAILATSLIWRRLGCPQSVDGVLDVLGLVWREEEVAATMPNVVVEGEC